MSRIRSTLLKTKSSGEKAMGLFLTSGFPDPESTLPLLEIADARGADFIELGMPFSDPLAEGLPVQRSSERALSYGTTLKDVFRTAERFRSHSETPLLLMGYINPIFRFGISNFCEAARSSGVDGLILPDLPLEESALIEESAHKAGLDLVFLIAPNSSDERIDQIDQKSTGFIYAVSITGLTGSNLDTMASVESYLERARKIVLRNPLLVGFGIRNHERAMSLSRHTDGFIVGSALINLVEELWNDPKKNMSDRLQVVGRFITELKYGNGAAAANISAKNANLSTQP